VIVSIVALIFVLILWLIMARFPDKSSLFVIAWAVFASVLIISTRLTRKLICPACKRSTEGEIIRFCPECGDTHLQQKGDDKFFLIAPRCSSCSKELIKMRGRRRYKIRFCTCCGAWLDERGV